MIYLKFKNRFTNFDFILKSNHTFYKKKRTSYLEVITIYMQ